MLDLARDSPGQTRPIPASFRLLPDRHGHLAGSSRQEIDRRNRDRSEYGLGDSYPVLLLGAAAPGVSSPCFGRALMECHHIS
ncbi:hypothetical protein T11_15738 [Trichinella zimbabwensis]|uniref:Uncharacterized protein n=1 Tax=Trichinella zimbabwensis TaxID=268475 RepID=A0A0V1I3C8_9BILA|nr:hypothetical protein T11_825 [Trichinella zimbabwensis]KRZ04044.1 hypothetical protein T11_2717 [Trichinella zimbabwensis]KRZ17292.1 hypothetical protein T11_15738 [Trichinella zimbabwensis]